MIWWILMVLSLTALACVIPVLVCTLADYRFAQYRPKPERSEIREYKFPRAHLSGREYRRILRDWDRYEKAARARRYGLW